MSRYVYEGPRWFRSRIRSRGPFLAVVPPAVLGLLAIIVLKLFDGKLSGYVGLLLGVFAAPGLLVIGAPFSDRSLYPIGVTISVLLWLVVGAVAAHRTTRNPMASWADFWRNYAWLAAGIWLGALGALLVARVAVGDLIS